jgi:competence protein ComEC
VLALRWKSVQVLFTGDISRNVEMALASSKELRPSVLKVAHHGSRTSSHPDFIREVSPEVALISCGRGHAYGHPHREVLQTLNDQGVAWYSTSTDGGLELNVFHDGKFTIHPTRKWRPVREWIPTHSDGI